MLKQLQKVYPSITYYYQIDSESRNNYHWFVNDNEKILGILKVELTEKDLILLSTFLKSYNQHIPEKTIKEQYWYNLIHQISTKKPTVPYRFVYFTMQKNQIEPLSFREAISQAFGKPIPILWESETNGILIEELTPLHEQINYEQIIDILIADLSVQIKFYIGELKDDINNLPSYYTTLIEVGNTIFHMTSNKVINYVESIPYLILHQIDQDTKDLLISNVLQKFNRDEEMLHTLEMFFQHNLNVSETSKKMYMHRNSIQYRIDKFINETGFNIQKFDHAITVKLALLAGES